MNDLISRQAAIDALGREPTGDAEYSLGCYNEWKRNVRAIEALPPSKEWIPVSERLPEVGVPVLTFDGKYMRVERHINWIDADGEKLKGEWWIDGTEGDNYNCVGLRDGTATHWMPLPEPYKPADNA